MSKQQHTLTYERTDDMSVLSDFYCGIDEMDNFIHNKLQGKIDGIPELESYIIREEGSIVAMTAIREKPLDLRKSDGSRFAIDALEIEYLAVRKDLRDTGIGESIIQWIDDKARNEHQDCRYLSVNALVDPDYGYSAVPFYEKCHFIARKSHVMAEAVRMTRIIR
ncbi:MAG: GNAT family N-acetyltransferase [Prevotella sp.]|nr:GNAT family N-acetyltransferase [Prevotella sp.]